MSGEHFKEYWVFGTFMLVIAWSQLAWAITAAARPIGLLEWFGIVLNTGVLSTYLVTRTIGDVIGPTPHAIEAAGFIDVFCTALEAGIIVGCIGLLATKGRGRMRQDKLLLAPATTGVLTAIMLSVSLVAGGSEMADAGPTSSDGDMHMSSSQASSIRLATTLRHADRARRRTSRVTSQRHRVSPNYGVDRSGPASSRSLSRAPFGRDRAGPRPLQSMMRRATAGNVRAAALAGR